MNFYIVKALENQVRENLKKKNTQISHISTDKTLEVLGVSIWKYQAYLKHHTELFVHLVTICNMEKSRFLPWENWSQVALENYYFILIIQA